MRSAFSGFPDEGIAFFRGLARNNRREWFLPRKTVFEETVRRPMEHLVEALNAAMIEFAPDYVTDPGKAIYRFYRDTRFSKDKTPYKDRIAANFPRRGLTRHDGASFYFSVNEKEIGVGGGVYMPEPETLAAIRGQIARKHEEFRRLISAARVRRLFGEFQGEQLARVPKGFSPEHPAADLLRYKQHLLYTELAPDIATTPALYTELRKRFEAMTPFLEFLNAPLASRKRKADARELW